MSFASFSSIDSQLDYCRESCAKVDSCKYYVHEGGSKCKFVTFDSDINPSSYISDGCSNTKKLGTCDWDYGQIMREYEQDTIACEHGTVEPVNVGSQLSTLSYKSLYNAFNGRLYENANDDSSCEPCRAAPWKGFWLRYTGFRALKSALYLIASFVDFTSLITHAQYSLLH